MKTTLIKNCRLVSPDVDLENVSIAIKGDRIDRIWLASETPLVADETVDASGMTAVPGFIDIHTHGARGHDVCDGNAAGVAEMAAAKLREGVTTFLPTTLTLPEEKLSAALRSVAEHVKSPAYSKGAKIPGVHLEGPFINKNCTGAQNPAYVRPPDFEEVARLNKIMRVLVVTFAPEVDGGMEFASKLASAGIVASCGHSDATCEQFRRARRAGVRHLTHFCNQMTKLHHREIGLVGAGLLDDEVRNELICDKVHVGVDMISLTFKCKPADRIMMITDSLAPSWLGDGDYELGGLKMYVKGGEARISASNALAGSTLKFNFGLRNVHEITGLPLSRVVKASSFNQACSLGLPWLGKIEPGYFADIALLNADFSVADVFMNGVRAAS